MKICRRKYERGVFFWFALHPILLLAFTIPTYKCIASNSWGQTRKIDFTEVKPVIVQIRIYKIAQKMQVQTREWDFFLVYIAPDIIACLYHTNLSISASPQISRTEHDKLIAQRPNLGFCKFMVRK